MRPSKTVTLTAHSFFWRWSRHQLKKEGINLSKQIRDNRNIAMTVSGLITYSDRFRLHVFPSDANKSNSLKFCWEIVPYKSRNISLNRGIRCQKSKGIKNRQYYKENKMTHNPNYPAFSMLPSPNFRTLVRNLLGFLAHPLWVGDSVDFRLHPKAPAICLRVYMYKTSPEIFRKQEPKRYS